MKNKFILMLGMILIGLTLVSAVSITDVSNTPKEVAPGKVVNINIEIENIFDYDVTNLDIKLDLSSENVPFAPYQSSSEKFLDELDEGDEDNFKFKLITLPDTSTGIYKIPVKISYFYEQGNSSLQGEKQELISIIVNSEPELKISLEDSVILTKGKENNLVLKIINSGLSDVKFLYANVNDMNGLKFLSEKKKYLGDIDSDDFDSVDYKVSVSSNAPNTITLPIILTFMDATNKEFTRTENLILKTYSLKEARKLGLVEKSKLTSYFVVFILILGYVVYRFLKKRKLKNKRR